MAKKKAKPPPPKPHRGRIQAQSHYPAVECEESVTWRQDESPTKADMLRMLGRLWAKLTDAQQSVRLLCRAQAIQWINNAPASGVDAFITGSFENPTMRGGVRIDIEVHAGHACTG